MTKKVIIIDDNLVALNVIKTSFAQIGWEAYGVQFATSAIELVYDIAPDLIVTDALMPIMGGFQFLKILRNENITSKIPVIVYSVLDEKNSKFYIKEERAEYYLKKTGHINELINLAFEVTQKHPLDDDEKFEILKKNKKLENFIFETKTPVQEKENHLNFEDLERQFKEKYDFTRTDEKILSDIYSILYNALKYDLALICINETIYFDIRDIILSPIFQNNILHSLNAKSSFLFKKYAPNLKVVTNEEEFLTKIKFDFDKNSINVIFYSKEKLKWQSDEDIETLRKLLEGFFKARNANRSSKTSKTNNISSKYFLEKLDFKFDNLNKSQLYCAIIEISNFKDIQDNFASDELDFINSKISEKLINFVSDDEQIYKNDEDEYNIVFYAKDEQNAMQKLNWIVDTLNEINIDEMKLDVLIGASNCRIDEQFNIYEAQKLARIALDSANSQNRVIIYGSK